MFKAAAEILKERRIATCYRLGGPGAIPTTPSTPIQMQSVVSTLSAGALPVSVPPQSGLDTALVIWSCRLDPSRSVAGRAVCFVNKLVRDTHQVTFFPPNTTLNPRAESLYPGGGESPPPGTHTHATESILPPPPAGARGRASSQTPDLPNKLRVKAYPCVVLFSDGQEVARPQGPAGTAAGPGRRPVWVGRIIGCWVVVVVGRCLGPQLSYLGRGRGRGRWRNCRWGRASDSGRIGGMAFTRRGLLDHRWPSRSPITPEGYD